MATKGPIPKRQPEPENSDRGTRANRSTIAEEVRQLRKKRGLTQAELGKVIGISQSRLSEIESGQGTFSAEQFIQLLKFFNVPLSHFDPSSVETAPTLQRALIQHGATNLMEDLEILPSQRLADINTLIRETVVEGGSSRHLTALAPVLIRNFARINLPKLYAQFKDYGLERRFLWLINNTCQAIDEVLLEQPPRSESITLKQARNTLADFAVPYHVSSPFFAEAINDSLGIPILSAKTRGEILQAASPLSKQWGILTTIQVKDFAQAIKDSYAGYTR